MDQNVPILMPCSVYIKTQEENFYKRIYRLQYLQCVCVCVCVVCAFVIQCFLSAVTAEAPGRGFCGHLHEFLLIFSYPRSWNISVYSALFSNIPHWRAHVSGDSEFHEAFENKVFKSVNCINRTTNSWKMFRQKHFHSKDISVQEMSDS